MRAQKSAGTCCDADNTAAGPKGTDLRWGGPGDDRIVSKLARKVGTPRQNCAVGFERHAVGIPCSNRNNTTAGSKAVDCNGSQFSDRCFIAKLSARIVAPCEYAAIVL